jgi:hypothetical protein
MHVLQRKDDEKIFQRGMVVKEKGHLLGIKGLNKGEKLKQLTFYYAKLLDDGSFGNGVESICNVQL